MFKKTRTLGNIFKHTNREPTDKLNQQHTVYKIPCQCPKAYYGESKRNMGTRLKDHQGQCKLADKTNRIKKFQWEQASILEIERDTNQRRLLEAIHVYKNKDIAMTVYSGKSDIPQSWFLTLDKSCNVAVTNERKCMCCCVIISNFLTFHLINRY